MLNGKKLWPLLVSATVLGALLLTWVSAGVLGDAAQVSVGVPARGDAARYEGGDGDLEVVVQWSGPHRVEDRWGLPREADTLAVTFHVERFTQSLEFDFEPGALEPFGMSYKESASASFATGPAPGAINPALDALRDDVTVSGSAASRWYPGWFGTSLYCAFRAGWQGMPLAELDGMDLHEACPALVTWGGPDAPPATLRHVGSAEVEGYPVEGYRVEVPWKEGPLEVTYWFAATAPYPLRITIGSGDDAYPYTLKGFERGSGGALPAEHEPSDAPDRRPGVASGDPGRWGLVVNDPSVFAFPPGDAIATLETSPAAAAFREYLVEHPEARVVEAAYSERREHRSHLGVTRVDVLEQTWGFTFTDPGGNGWAVNVTRLVPRSEVPADPLAPVPGGGATTDGGHAALLRPLDPDAYPQEVVTLDDLVRLWRDTASGEAKPTSVRVVYGDVFADEGDGGRGYVRLAHTEDTMSGSREAAMGFRPRTGATVFAFSSRVTLSGAFWGGGTGDAFTTSAARVVGPDTIRGLTVPTAAATLLALTAYYGGAVLREVAARGLAMPLFHRLRGGEVLAHPRRRRLLDAVRETPGIHAGALEQSLGWGTGAVAYHLEVLRREGYVTRVKAGGYTRFFPAGSMDHASMRAEAVLRAGSLRDVLDLVAASPGLTQREIADRLGVSAPAVSRALKRLEREGLVRKAREGRVTRVYAAADPAVRVRP